MRIHRVSTLVAAGFLFLAAVSTAALPRVINYQARLTDSGGAPVKTAVTLTFTFWDAETGGAQLGGGYTDVKLVQPDANGVVYTQVGTEPGNPIPATVFVGASVWLNTAVDGQDITPRLRITAVGYAFRAADTDAVGGITASAFASLADAFPRRGGAHVVVETTASATVNGASLLDAYAAAKAISPNGSRRTAGNRVAVLLPPGSYDLGGAQLVLDAEFVDIIGMSAARDDQQVSGNSGGAGTGVLGQTADDVRIENLVVECRWSETTGILTQDDPAAYFPGSSTTHTVVRNCEFRADDLHAWSMRLDTAYPGTYTDCRGGSGAFGFGPLGLASGTFLRCIGGFGSFGAAFGSASGKFTACEGGDSAFGGFFGTASGTFTDCAGGMHAFGGYYGTASGAFTRCAGAGYSFGSEFGIASGTFTDCTGEYNAFGSSHGEASGDFVRCKGGGSSFGCEYATASGRFTECSSPTYFSFGSNHSVASGIFINCVGDDWAFGSYYSTASGWFTGCVGDSASFGGGASGIASGTFTDCRGPNMCFGGMAATGVFTNCTAGSYSFGDQATADGGRFYHCTADSNSFTTAGTPAPVFVYCVRAGAPYP
jgi:hypothetical protein